MSEHEGRLSLVTDGLVLIGEPIMEHGMLTMTCEALQSQARVEVVCDCRDKRNAPMFTVSEKEDFVPAEIAAEEFFLIFKETSSVIKKAYRAMRAYDRAHRVMKAYDRAWKGRG